MSCDNATLIQFSKLQTAVSAQYLIESIAELAEIKPVPECINKLSIVLAVMRKCHKAAPDIPNLPVEYAETIFDCPSVSVHSVTVRLYCSCGDALHTTSDWPGAYAAIREFWSQHQGDGHGPTTPRKARYARKRRSERA